MIKVGYIWACLKMEDLQVTILSHAVIQNCIIWPQVPQVPRAASDAKAAAQVARVPLQGKTVVMVDIYLVCFDSASEYY